MMTKATRKLKFPSQPEVNPAPANNSKGPTGNHRFESLIEALEEVDARYANTELEVGEDTWQHFGGGLSYGETKRGWAKIKNSSMHINIVIARIGWDEPKAVRGMYELNAYIL